MNQKSDEMVADEETEMLPEYDFSQGVRGKHTAAYRQGYSVTVTHPDGSQEVRKYEPSEDAVVLDSDVARFFPTAEAVNEALRFLIRAAQQGNPVLREHEDTAYTADSEETEPPA